MIEKKPHENFYQKVKWYSVTINPCDSHQKFNTLNRFDNFVKMMKTMFYEIFDSKGIAYIGNIEVSEPRKLIESKGPRLHWHGRILFNKNEQIFQWLTEDLGKLARLGSVDIDIINDIVVWDHYCRKQTCIMPEKACLYNSYTILMIQMKNAESFVSPPEGDGVSRGGDMGLEINEV